MLVDTLSYTQVSLRSVSVVIILGEPRASITAEDGIPILISLWALATVILSSFKL